MNWIKELDMSQSQINTLSENEHITAVPLILRLFILWWQNVRERDHLKDLDIEERFSFKRIFKKSYWKA